MCGIGGIIDRSTAGAATVRSRCERMATAMVHRGPDDFGSYYDVDQGVGLVHRRLSIIDLSEAGHQPMVTADGRYTIVFNGEIYNYGKLREDLQGQGEVLSGTPIPRYCFVGISEKELRASIALKGCMHLRFGIMFPNLLRSREVHSESSRCIIGNKGTVSRLHLRFGRCWKRI